MQCKSQDLDVIWIALAHQFLRLSYRMCVDFMLYNLDR